MKSAIEKIEDHGLHFIMRRVDDGSPAGKVLYAVFIDGTGNEPTAEQIRECLWYGSARDAADQYMTRNYDHFKN